MKKIICILLIIAISLGLSGCSENVAGYVLSYMFAISSDVPKYEQRRMLKHLEEKYGEEFVIKEILLPVDASSFNRGATVYPKGREDEEFYVSLGTRGSKKIIDNYVLREPQKKMTPIYEEWIQSVFPSAKVGVRLSHNYSHDLFYDPDKSLQQFVDDSSGDIDCDISILLSEELLTDKDEVFEKLSKLPGTEPISGFDNAYYTIGFMKKDAFDNVKSGEYIHIPPAFFSDSSDDEDYVAVTYFYAKNLDNEYYSKEETIEWLNERYERQEDLSELEDRMFPVYEKWIQSAVPSAKVAINLVLRVEDSQTFYHPDQSFQQFADEAKDVDCHIDIILSEEFLPKKDEIFEKLGTLFEIPPVSFYKGTWFSIAFMTKDEFDKIGSGEFIHIPTTFQYDADAYRKFLATSWFRKKRETLSKEEIIEILHNEFVQNKFAQKENVE